MSQTISSNNGPLGDGDNAVTSVEISDEALAILRDIAKKYKVTLDEALVRALSHEQLISTELSEGGRLLVEKNKVLREVVTR
jgi:hypothetical protein